MQTKRQLTKILAIQDRRFFKQSFCIENITPFIREGDNQKKRLIEASSKELKKIQTNIKKILQVIPVKNFVFSGIKGVSYPENAQYHKLSSSYVFKTDLTGFFPSISRDSVFSFFHDDMGMSSDTANITTNLLTVDLRRDQVHDLNAVFNFLQEKDISCTNHLLTGSPASTILSYLVNYKMFDSLFAYAEKNYAKMTVYIDDLTFSSENKIPYYFRKKVLHILSINGFCPAKHKTKYCGSNIAKLVTGVILDKYEMKVPNKLRRKVLDSYNEYKKDNKNFKVAQSAKGVLNSARHIESEIFPSLIFRARD